MKAGWQKAVYLTNNIMNWLFFRVPLSHLSWILTASFSLLNLDSSWFLQPQQFPSAFFRYPTFPTFLQNVLLCLFVFVWVEYYKIWKFCLRLLQNLEISEIQYVFYNIRNFGFCMIEFTIFFFFFGKFNKVFCHELEKMFFLWSRKL